MSAYGCNVRKLASWYYPYHNNLHIRPYYTKLSEVNSEDSFFFFTYKHIIDVKQKKSVNRKSISKKILMILIWIKGLKNEFENFSRKMMFYIKANRFIKKKTLFITLMDRIVYEIIINWFTQPWKSVSVNLRSIYQRQAVS